MRNKKWYNAGHAENYLSGSVIRIDNVPCYVCSVGESKMEYYPITEKNNHRVIDLDHPAIDLNPMPLGFLSLRETDNFHSSSYLKRGPYRQWKVGTTARNTISANPFKHAIKSSPMMQYILRSQEFCDTVAGKYIDPEQAHALSAKNEQGAFAFSRRFAVFKDFLLYKDLQEPVGTVSKDGTVLLHEDFTYLTDMLNEDLDACGHH